MQSLMSFICVKIMWFTGKNAKGENLVRIKTFYIDLHQKQPK